jgi:hypothetical protein
MLFQNPSIPAKAKLEIPSSKMRKYFMQKPTAKYIDRLSDF